MNSRTRTHARRLGRGARALALICLLVLAALSLSACGQQQTPADQSQNQAVPEPDTSTPAAEEPSMPSDVKESDTLQKKDLKVGDGAVAETGKTVTVNYVGWLTDGTKFDSSYQSGQPFTFPLGQGQVIQGWDEGVAGMKVGGRRLLVIPPSLGYGESGAGGVIPPNATLVFIVDLLDVQ